jgi:hypothetical protein
MQTRHRFRFARPAASRSQISRSKNFPKTITPPSSRPPIPLPFPSSHSWTPPLPPERRPLQSSRPSPSASDAAAAAAAAVDPLVPPEAAAGSRRRRGGHAPREAPAAPRGVGCRHHGEARAPTATAAVSREVRVDDSWLSVPLLRRQWTREARVLGFGRRFRPFSWVAVRRELAGLRAQGFDRFVLVDVDGVLISPCWVYANVRCSSCSSAVAEGFITVWWFIRSFYCSSNCDSLVCCPIVGYGIPSHATRF